MQVRYHFEIVGGRFDGAGKMAWIDDGKTPPPDRIVVGVCDVGMRCGTSKCRPTSAHVSYWLPDEEGRPAVGADPYTKQHEYVDGEPLDGELQGRAVYAVGGLLDPRNFGEAARAPAGVSFEFAGHHPEVTAFAAGRHDRGWPR